MHRLNQHGWTKCSVAIPVLENIDCAFPDSRGCIFIVNQQGWTKCSVATSMHKNTDCAFMALGVVLSW